MLPPEKDDKRDEPSEAQDPQEETPEIPEESRKEPAEIEGAEETSAAERSGEPPEDTTAPEHAPDVQPGAPEEGRPREPAGTEGAEEMSAAERPDHAAAPEHDPAVEEAADRGEPADREGTVADVYDPVPGGGAEAPKQSEPAMAAGGEPGRPAPPPPRSGGSFWSALLAAVVGGAIGAGGIWYWLQQEDPPGPDPQIVSAIEQREAEAEAQAERLATLESDIGSLNEALSATDLSAAVERLRMDAEGRLQGMSDTLASVDQRLEALEGRLAEIETRTEQQADRIAELEARPIADPETATEVLREEVAAMRAEVEQATEAARSQVETMRNELAAAAEETQTQIVEAERRAAELEAQAQERLRAAEEEAQARARAAEAQAALAQVEVALDSGVPYAEELATLAGNTEAEIPDALASSAQTGVPTIAELQEAYPEAARAALSATAAADAEGGAGERLVAFLRNQTQARSLTPQEGDNPDAILSRAEAALEDGDAAAALAELEALPQEGRAAMQDWIDAARTRAGAVEAAAALSQEMN